MKLPDTENANYHHAFKKGYRLAMEGKPLSHMPSQIKYDGQMREYFQMGWEQYREELNEALENEDKAPWKSRAIWAVMMVVAGLGTASLMISNIHKEKALQQKLIDNPEAPHQDYLPTQKQAPQSKLAMNSHAAAKPMKTLELHSAEKQLPAPKEKTAQGKPQSEAKHDGLSLLNEQSRKDLAKTKQQNSVTPKEMAIEPIMPSEISVTSAVFTRDIKNKESTETITGTVPKYIRKLYFFTQISGAKGQTIYHRWLYRQQVMAIIPLKIKGNLYRTWSSKRLSSAWPGQWTVEVLDHHKQVIYRQQFNYIRP